MTIDKKFDFAPLSIGAMRLGKWGANMNTKELQAFVEGCIEMGLHDFDHADIYGDYTTESDFGKVLGESPGLKDQIQLITKCGIMMMCDNRPAYKIKSYDTTKTHIIASAENSLKQLQADRIDLLLIHRPDLLLSPDEVAEAFAQLHQAGKVKAFGVSNFTPSQFDLLNSTVPLATNQIEASVMQRAPFEDGTLNQCMQHNIRPMAWSPLGGGAVFGTGGDEQTARVRNTAQLLSDKHNVALDQILLAWLLKHPSGIVPVLGTAKLDRVKKAKAALEIALSHEEWYELWQASAGQEVA